jgi:hypothetical protein
MTPYPHLIRESAVLDEEQYVLLGSAGAKRLMAQVERKARATAKRVGINRVVVRAKQWDLDVVCPTDYPMYLCGPNAPRLTCAADVFNHVYHLDNPLARYTVVLEDKRLHDQKEREWMDGLVAQARAQGLDSLSERWAPNVIEKVRRAMRVRA